MLSFFFCFFFRVLLFVRSAYLMRAHRRPPRPLGRNYLWRTKGFLPTILALTPIAHGNADVDD